MPNIEKPEEIQIDEWMHFVKIAGLKSLNANKAQNSGNYNAR